MITVMCCCSATLPSLCHPLSLSLPPSQSCQQAKANQPASQPSQPAQPASQSSQPASQPVQQASSQPQAFACSSSLPTLALPSFPSSSSFLPPPTRPAPAGLPPPPSPFPSPPSLCLFFLLCEAGTGSRQALCPARPGYLSSSSGPYLRSRTAAHCTAALQRTSERPGLVPDSLRRQRYLPQHKRRKERATRLSAASQSSVA